MKSVYKFLKILIVLIGVGGTVFFAFYPFRNRDITLKLYDDKGSLFFSDNITAEQVLSGGVNVLEIPLKNGVQIIGSLRIYGMSKTTVAKELNFESLNRMIDNVLNGSWEWEKNGIKVTGTETVKIQFTDEYVHIMQKQSASLLQERLLCAGYFVCFILILFMIVNVFEEKLSDTVKNNHSFMHEVKKFFMQMKKYKNYMVFSAKADLNAEVANSYLNRLWWLLEPFFNMMVYVIVFGRVMGHSVQNYATFVFSALLMWNYFSKTVNYSVKLVRNNRDIISKVYVPKFVLLLSNMFLNFFKLLFSLIVLLGMLLIFRVNIGINILWVIPSYVLMILLSFGIGMIFLHYGVYIDDLAYAVGILLNMLMFLSGIFYNVMLTLPDPLNVLMMTFNPVAVFIDVMRNALLNNSAVNMPLLGLWTLISILLCYIGIHTVYKNENSYVKII